MFYYKEIRMAITNSKETDSVSKRSIVYSNCNRGVISKIWEEKGGRGRKRRDER